MNNMTTREKAMAFGILLILIIFLVYFFGIRILNDNYKKYQEDLKTLQDRKKFLDELKEENANTELEIKQLNADIEKIELSFIDKIESENIEQYMFNIFEKNECPYLTEVKCEDVAMTPIQLADGTTSDNMVLRRSFEISYVTGDGFLPKTYNGEPSLRDDKGEANEELINELIKYLRDRIDRAAFDYENDKKENPEPGNPETEIKYFEEYDGFIDSIKEIAAANKDCIKLSEIKAESTHGYMKLTAKVDFFGATIVNRVSKDNNKEGYTWWTGHTNIDTKGGFIGQPFFVKNPDSKWFHTALHSKEVIGFFDRPYTHYCINALFSKILMNENSMKSVTGYDYFTGSKDQNQNQNADPNDMQQVSQD